MTTLRSLYQPSLALLTDLYELTMAYGFWQSGMGERRAAFHLHFRRNPFGGGYTVAAGLASVVDFLGGFRFASEDLDYLAGLRGNDGGPLFDDGFVRHLEALRLRCDVDAVPEGTVVFPQEPLLRVVGPILEAQILETSLLNLLNFPTLVATKAARVCEAARGDDVLEFGLRRAQGVDGGLTASRAAYLGGCAGTSNVLAGRLYGIPVKGTHAHSWVMAFDGEIEAFEAWAEAMPNNCVFLVDTYDTLQGVHAAVEIGRRLRERGHRMIGVRLDSGDLAYLSIQARRILDEAGLDDAVVVASNNLDERLIQSLKQQGATIAVWGVGTRLATAYDQPALGGVYKLTMVEDGTGWTPRIKLSEQVAKISTPGIQQVRRFLRDGEFAGDAIFDETLGIAQPLTIVDPYDATRRKRFAPDTRHEDLLVPVLRAGEVVHTPAPLDESRRRARTQIDRLHAGIRRFDNPHQYPVGLEQRLHETKTRLVLEARAAVERRRARNPG